MEVIVQCRNCIKWKNETTAWLETFKSWKSYALLVSFLDPQNRGSTKYPLFVHAHIFSPEHLICHLPKIKFFKIYEKLLGRIFQIFFVLYWFTWFWIKVLRFSIVLKFSGQNGPKMSMINDNDIWKW